VTTAVPLIGVLALTAIKDAYDDIVSSEIRSIAISQADLKLWAKV
jgi:hypothetical protein